jgi:hypothetical protein
MRNLLCEWLALNDVPTLADGARDTMIADNEDISGYAFFR